MADQRELTASGGQQLPLRLQSASDVRARRDQVLSKYEGFKEAARKRREKLEEAKRFQQFKRSADELEAWVNEKMQIVSDESHKDRTNLQVKTSAIRNWLHVLGVGLVNRCYAARLAVQTDPHIWRELIFKLGQNYS